jgi:hypothetical protein
MTEYKKIVEEQAQKIQEEKQQQCFNWLWLAERVRGKSACCSLQELQRSIRV